MGAQERGVGGQEGGGVTVMGTFTDNGDTMSVVILVAGVEQPMQVDPEATGLVGSDGAPKLLKCWIEEF